MDGNSVRGIVWLNIRNILYYLFIFRYPFPSEISMKNKFIKYYYVYVYIRRFFVYILIMFSEKVLVSFSKSFTLIRFSPSNPKVPTSSTFEFWLKTNSCVHYKCKSIWSLYGQRMNRFILTIIQILLFSLLLMIHLLRSTTFSLEVNSMSESTDFYTQD